MATLLTPKISNDRSVLTVLKQTQLCKIIGNSHCAPRGICAISSDTSQTQPQLVVAGWRFGWLP